MSEDERRDPPGNDEETGRTSDPDGNFVQGDTTQPEDRPGSRFSEEHDGSFGDDPVDEDDG